MYFAGYLGSEGTQAVDEPFEEVASLTGPRLQVLKRYSRFGWLAAVNSGRMGTGFRVCKTCGWADLPSLAGRNRTARGGQTAHKNPRTGKPCSGSLATYALGHRFMTDILEVHLEGWLAAAGSDETWLSLLHALLEGASEALGIRRDDLDGTLYHHKLGLAPAILLFDNVPGGAGHVRRIAESLRETFDAALSRVDRNCCGPETSCYECLRNFRNQPYHDQLKRGLARDFLTNALAKP